MIAAGPVESLEFFVACVPPKASHHQKKIVRRGRFMSLADKPELVAARNSWLAMLQPYAPQVPIAGAVSLTIELEWPWRSSDSKRVRLLGRIPSTVKPDCSNMAKTIEDCLELARFMENDAAVSELVVRKWIGNRPGVKVRLCRFGISNEVGKEQPMSVDNPVENCSEAEVS